MDRGNWWATVHGVAKQLGTISVIKQEPKEFNHTYINKLH